MTDSEADLDNTYLAAILVACKDELELHHKALCLDEDGHASGLLIRGDRDLTFYASKKWIAENEMTVDECVEGVQSWVDGTVFDLPVPGVGSA
jgi:hypothetical protein